MINSINILLILLVLIASLYGALIAIYPTLVNSILELIILLGLMEEFLLLGALQD